MPCPTSWALRRVWTPATCLLSWLSCPSKVNYAPFSWFIFCKIEHKANCRQTVIDSQIEFVVQDLISCTVQNLSIFLIVSSEYFSMWKVACHQFWSNISNENSADTARYPSSWAAPALVHKWLPCIAEIWGWRFRVEYQLAFEALRFLRFATWELGKTGQFHTRIIKSFITTLARVRPPGVPDLDHCWAEYFWLQANEHAAKSNIMTQFVLHAPVIKYNSAFAHSGSTCKGLSLWASKSWWICQTFCHVVWMQVLNELK